MKIVSLSLCAAIALATPLPAWAAQDAVAGTAVVAPVALELRKNKTLVDADGHNLGKVYEVNTSGGVVTFMSQMKIYQLPISTLSADGAKLKTSLTKAKLGL